MLEELYLILFPRLDSCALQENPTKIEILSLQVFNSHLVFNAIQIPKHCHRSLFKLIMHVDASRSFLC